MQQRILRVTACAIACLFALRAGAQNPVQWSLTVVTKGPIVPGRTFETALTATIEKGWHLYAMSQPDSGPTPTVITLAPGVFEALGDVNAPVGTFAFDPNFGVTTEFFEDRATFLIPLKAPSANKEGRHKLSVAATWVTCNDRLCLPPTDAVISLDIDVGTVSVAAKDSSARAAPTSSVTFANPVPVATSTAAKRGPVVDMAAETRASTLGAYIGLAALMGGLSLLTPCVFPMVPITVSYFTNHARRRRREAISQALVYGLGIILTFTALGFVLALVFGASGITQFSANPWVNLAVTVMFVVFALSLFGIREIALPSKLITAVSRIDSGSASYGGTLAMGLAFTLTSFTCTAPFLGTLLVVASQGDWQWPLAGMLAFATVFATPFMVLAFLPQIIASLPKSGPWLVDVKAVMGIVELAAAMKFLSNVDLVWGWHIFTRPVLLVVWTILAAILVAFLFGVVRLGTAPRVSRPGMPRVAAGLVAAGCAVWLAGGLSGRRLGELEAFLPPADMSPASTKGELAWIHNDYKLALATAANPEQRVLIDFTGYTCTNCRWMEANMFPRPDVARELARYVRVRLYTDGRGDLYRGFQAMEQEMFGTVALPYYAVMTAAGEPIIGFGGLTRDPAQYIAFLRKGQR